MTVYKVIRKDNNYVRNIHETKADAMAYIEYLKWLNPQYTYYCEEATVLPKGYGQYWEKYAQKQKQNK